MINIRPLIHDLIEFLDKLKKEGKIKASEPLRNHPKLFEIFQDLVELIRKTEIEYLNRISHKYSGE